MTPTQSAIWHFRSARCTSHFTSLLLIEYITRSNLWSHGHGLECDKRLVTREDEGEGGGSEWAWYEANKISMFQSQNVRCTYVHQSQNVEVPISKCEVQIETCLRKKHVNWFRSLLVDDAGATTFICDYCCRSGQRKLKPDDSNCRRRISQW